MKPKRVQSSFAFFYKKRKRMQQRYFIKNVKEHKECSVLFIKKAKERENVAFFWKERKRTQERCVLLKRMHAQPWFWISWCKWPAVMTDDSGHFAFTIATHQQKQAWRLRNPRILLFKLIWIRFHLWPCFLMETYESHKNSKSNLKGQWNENSII